MDEKKFLDIEPWAEEDAVKLQETYGKYATPDFINVNKAAWTAFFNGYNGLMPTDGLEGCERIALETMTQEIFDGMVLKFHDWGTAHKRRKINSSYRPHDISIDVSTKGALADFIYYAGKSRQYLPFDFENPPFDNFSS